MTAVEISMMLAVVTGPLSAVLIAFGSLLCLSVLHGLYLLPALESSLSDNHRISGTRRPLERSGALPLALLPQ